jgi:kinesin family protein 2/24
MFVDINCFHHNVNRVKSLSKSGNPRKDQAPNPVSQSDKEVLSTSSLPDSTCAEDFYDQRQEVKTVDMGRKVIEKEKLLYSSGADADKQPSSFSSSSFLFSGREEKGLPSVSMDRNRFEVKNSTNQKINPYSQNDADDKVQKVSPPRRKGAKEERSERSSNWPKRDPNGYDHFTTSSKQSTGNYNTVATGSRQLETESSSPDVNISAVLEVWQNI